jgi:branched-subunit amino acid transport protein
MRKLLIFAGMAVATYITRFSMIATLGTRSRAEESSLLRRWLRYVPPAVLAALIAPPILAPDDRLSVGLPFWAAVVGVGVAWHTRSVFWTILGGLLTFWLLRALGAH